MTDSSIPLIHYQGGENSCMRLRSIFVHVDINPTNLSLRARCYQHEGKKKIVWGSSISSRSLKSISDVKVAIERCFRGRVRAVCITYATVLNQPDEYLEFDSVKPPA